MSEIIVIGAGAAGLTAARELRRSGREVCVLEARHRIGGRMWTMPGPAGPVELGAEFIHGKPPILLDALQAAGIAKVEIATERLLAESGGLRPMENFWSLIEQVDRQIDPSVEQSYEHFLTQAEASPFAKRIARAYVEGFNAARAERISAPSIALEDQASEQVEGDKQFRPRHGYGPLVRWLADTMDASRIRLGVCVTEIHWRAGAVTICAETEEGRETFQAERVVVTLPLGVLKQPGRVRFFPGLPGKEETMRHIEMGHVSKVVMHFKTPFWEEPEFVGNHAAFGFALCLDAPFPTWWTQQPLSSHLITGWAGGSRAEDLAGCPREQIKALALQSLAQTFHIDIARLRADLIDCYFHNWSADPFALGAYSYPGLGGIAAARQLGEPVAGTLFFAGEATDCHGFNGTVHGAMESGRRVAAEILARDAHPVWH